MADLRTRAGLRGRTLLRFVGRRRSFAFGAGFDVIGQIRVINLDRQPGRWRQVTSELDRWRTGSGERLSALTRRSSGVDARHAGAADPSELLTTYRLSEQLAVEPNALLRLADAEDVVVAMSKEEAAVARSHVEVWRAVAAGDVDYVLVLEDDVFLERGFARRIDRAWAAICTDSTATGAAFDVLFVSFVEVGRAETRRRRGGASYRRPDGGLWQASGYVLSREGARALLAGLPVHGPVDLWLNLQFDRLRVLLVDRPLISQRPGVPSGNSYSIMPVLSRLGVVRDVHAHLPPPVRLPGPVLALGGPDTGLTALALALSMLGYTCLSDVDELPAHEERLLRAGGRGAFNALVNVGGVDLSVVADLTRRWPRAKVIVTGPVDDASRIPPHALLLTPDTPGRWAALCQFLSLEYPTHDYPTAPQAPLRALVGAVGHSRRGDPLAWDRSPWVVAAGHGMRPRVVSPPSAEGGARASTLVDDGVLRQGVWAARSDTFPGNLSLFTANNVCMGSDGAVLEVRREDAVVRDTTAGAVATVAQHLYGRFAAELRPSPEPGLITGIFLHRNGPRQEIDIELLGRDTTKLLANVFYNPGPEGTRLEYGYRGTPVLIDLGFDASEATHLYEICWTPEAVQWIVDGHVVHERFMWDPTPIPDRPLEFNVNLWYSASRELAGRLRPEALPARTTIQNAWIIGT